MEETSYGWLFFNEKCFNLKLYSAVLLSGKVHGLIT